MDIKKDSYATVAKTIINNEAKIAYCVRREPDGENDTGWMFFTDKEMKISDVSEDSFTFVNYIELIKKVHPVLRYVYRLPVDTSAAILQYSEQKTYLIDTISGKDIDYIKYDNLPEGTPISEVLVKKSGILSRLLGR